MRAALFVVGVLLAVGGTAIIYWPAAVVVCGLGCIVAAVDLTPESP